MNSLMQEKWPWIEGTHGMCTQFLELLDDGDLAFSPGGQNMTLGALLCELGDVKASYNQSLKTFKQAWLHPEHDADLFNHVDQIKHWFEALDSDLKTTIAELSDEDIKKSIDRNGYPMPVTLQIDIYIQALLIFLGKATIYLKTLNKPLPQSMQEYI